MNAKRGAPAQAELFEKPAAGIAFDALVQQLVVPAFVVGIDGKVLVWNRACEQITGMRAQDVVGSADHWRAFYDHERPCLADLIARQSFDLIEKLYASFDDSAEIYGGVHAENWCTMPLRGVELYLSIDAGPIHDASGKLVAAVETLRDLTAWKRDEEQLRLIQTVFDNSLEGIMITDPECRILRVNAAFTTITGYAADEVAGKTPRILQSGMQDAHFYQEMWAALHRDGHWQGEVWNRRQNAELYPERLSITAVRDRAGAVSHYVGMFSDITVQKQAQERLEDMATHDALTGLPNRIALSVKLHQALAAARQNERMVAVCFIDLDGFKPINDTHGHEVGDRVLVEVARRLRHVIRASDTVARIGGDEFVVLLNDFVRLEEVELALSRLHNALRQPVALDELKFGVSASIGVTVHPRDGADADTLIRHADQAMYIAKGLGRNTWHMFDSSDEPETQKTDTLQAQVRRGLEESEFRLYYQPKVNLRSGKIVGYEALIRWQHPERGLLTPGDFLPQLENTPIIVELGEWVILEALAQIARWQAMGLPLKVSVNIAARQFQHIDFVMGLRSILAQYPEVSPSLFEIEVLESTALDDVENVRAVLLACQEMGVASALDDFGTGYSTLTYLKRLPAQTLKIDQSFVRDMLEDKEDLALIEGVIGLASVFRMDVVAEGVETLEQGIVLMRVGCDVVQGYYIARPMPADDVPGWHVSFEPEPAWRKWADSGWDRKHLPLVLAEYDHLKWVQRVLALCAGEEVDFEESEISDPHACRFGKWYDSDGTKMYGSLRVFKDIAPIHRRVHETARRMLQLHQAGDQAGLQAQAEVLLNLKEAIVKRLETLRGKLLDGKHALPADPAPGREMDA